MRVVGVFLAVSLASWAFLAPECNAHRRFLASLPNNDKVPCVGGSSCCNGSPICAAFGHARCCPHSDENSFGDQFDEDSNSVKWSTSTNGDSDGDGYSNGDELGDPCIQFTGGTPSETWDISHPGESSSKPKERATCSQASPTGPSGATAARSTSGDIIVFSLATTRSDTCWCWRGVHDATGTVVRDHNSFPNRPPTAATIQSASPKSQWAKSDAMRLCNVPSWVGWVTVQLHNLHGSSTTQNLTLSTASADVDRADAYEALLPCAKDAGAFSTKSYQPTNPPEPSTVLALPLILGGIGLVVGSWLVYLCSNRVPCGKNPCMGIFMAPGCARAMVARNPYLLLGQTGSASFLGVTTTLAVLAVPLATMLLSIPIFDATVFPSGHQASVGRAIGMATLPLIFLACVTGTKVVGGPILALMSPDRVLVLHRWLGTAATIAALVHAILLIVAVSESTLPLTFLLAWSSEWEVNVCAGTIAGIVMLLMGVTALLRRRFYAAFWAMHAIGFPLTVLFTLLHLTESPTGAGGLMGFSIGLLVFDALVAFVLPLCTSRTRVVQARVALNGGENGRGVVELVMERSGWGGAKIESGKYAHILLPSLSLVSHPFTVVRADTSSESTRFTFLIRSEGKGTFTGKLYDAVKEYSEAQRTQGGVAPALRGFVLAIAPYSSPHPARIETYSNIAFVCGGIGVTPALGMVHRFTSGKDASGKDQQVPSTKFSLLWVVREEGLVAPALAQLAEDTAAASLRDPRTATTALLAASPSLEMTVAVPRSTLAAPIVTTRPDLMKFLRGVLASCPKDGSVAVLVCGPEGLKAATLDAVFALNSSRLHVLTEEFKF